MERICKETLCTACHACLNICPHHAIEFHADNMGYLYPHINDKICIGCGMCVRTCPVNRPVVLHHPQRVLAARNNDITMLRSCASGGISTLLCHSVILAGGIAYGCVAPNFKETYHDRADSIEQVVPMQGSKYVQSSIGLIFRDVRKDLRDGKKVIFTGVPCQVAGLKNFLGKDYKNLLTVDLLCHGVSSQQLLIDNVQDIFNKYHKDSRAIKLQFRRKFNGPAESINVKYGLWFEDGLEENAGIPHRESDIPYNNYIAGFMSELILRENCYSCPYAQVNRVGDVTLADFWGLNPSSSVKKHDGVSLVLINTDKGSDAISDIKKRIEMEDRSLKEAIQGNGRLSHPSRRPTNRDTFIREYASGHDAAYRKALKTYRVKYRYQHIRFIVISWLRKSSFILNLYNWLKRRALDNV